MANLVTPKFNVGDRTIVTNVYTPSSIGYLGYYGTIKIIKFNENKKEHMYFMDSINGTGGAWFYEGELKMTYQLNKASAKTSK